MQVVLTAINEQPILRQRLFQMEFLTTLSGDALVSLIYHKKLDDDWEDAARALAQSLNLAMVGRSRKQKRVIGRDFVLEEVQVGATTFRYQQVETGVTQPHGRAGERKLTWAGEKRSGGCGDRYEM